MSFLFFLYVGLIPNFVYFKYIIHIWNEINYACPFFPQDFRLVWIILLFLDFVPFLCLVLGAIPVSTGSVILRLLQDQKCPVFSGMPYTYQATYTALWLRRRIMSISCLSLSPNLQIKMQHFNLLQIYHVRICQWGLSKGNNTKKCCHWRWLHSPTCPRAYNSFDPWPSLGEKNVFSTCIVHVNQTYIS